MESITPILEFKKTCVSYSPQTMAVKYVSAAIERNTITAIMGPDYSTVCLNWWPVESNTSETQGSIASKSTVQVEMTAVSTV